MYEGEIISKLLLELEGFGHEFRKENRSRCALISSFISIDPCKGNSNVQRSKSRDLSVLKKRSDSLLCPRAAGSIHSGCHRIGFPYKIRSLDVVSPKPITYDRFSLYRIVFEQKKLKKPSDSPLELAIWPEWPGPRVAFRAMAGG